MAKRAFLNMAGGRVEGDQLFIECDNDLVKNTLSKEDVVEIFQATAAEVLGQAVAVKVITKSAAGVRPAVKTPVQEAKPAATPRPVGEGGNDPLDNLLNRMQGVDHFKIQ